MGAPAVSVIIPMFNAEKYIGVCLDSILAQTFQDFEVIVVNDCSTDDSVKVVESYAQKFGGRLKLSATEKNSGNPGVPDNMGIRFSHGEYLLILDADDALTFDAIEKLYLTAKEFDADVVACEKYYEVPTQFFNDAKYLPKIAGCECQADAPTLLESDPSKRLSDFVQRKFLWNLWSKLIRRDFVTKNGLRFTDNFIHDMIFTCCLVFAAEKFVCVPYIVNRYRLLDDSLSHKAETSERYLKKYLRALRTGFDYLNDFLSKRAFFRQQPEYKSIVLNVLVSDCLQYFANVYEEISDYAAEEIVCRDLASENFSPALTAVILNRLNVFQLNLKRANNRIADLEKSARQDKAYIAELEKLATQLLRKE